ncbi:DUF2357 domain-containing protein [Devosia sp. RR2S18]|uniref:DUF2357 domain-containing protein n=1 Tax=Devosia rhizosphaerae TaxID=3049774 RepID=UPI00254184E9|nr:DUF2357 domain-containing protein [Devosia sp. RR2S18]WIJ25796.1 DUF2357 domain-containing protein [Devosia sp. RR2S18]
MDVIVRQALELSRTLDELDRSPRRVLRRTHEMLPLARVQEMDRRAMNWLVRQPGETLAERAGDAQRVLAVVRRENFDTLENRVVRAYSELAGFVARDYLERNARKRATGRALRVKDYGKRVKRLSRDFTQLNIRSTEPGVTPNFVLQQNPSYHAVWEAWQELLDQDKQIDDLWIWQAASWEEFCALALNVAIGTISGAKLIASAPLIFREEQQQGSWISHDNPLGVFHLPDHKVVVEVQFRVAERTSAQADLGTQLWVRFGHTDDPAGFHKYLPVWCLWDAAGGLPRGEVTEVATLIQRYRSAGVVGSLVIRPAPHETLEVVEAEGSALAVSMASEGPGLRDAINTIAQFIISMVEREVSR